MFVAYPWWRYSITCWTVCFIRNSTFWQCAGVVWQCAGVEIVKWFELIFSLGNGTVESVFFILLLFCCQWRPIKHSTISPILFSVHDQREEGGSGGEASYFGHACAPARGSVQPGVYRPVLQHSTAAGLLSSVTPALPGMGVWTCQEAMEQLGGWLTERTSACEEVIKQLY